MLEASEEQTAISEIPMKVEPPRVLSAEGLSLAFGGNTVLRNINLELFAGDVVLLRGENGSGKTTLLNILTGNLEPDRGVICIYDSGQSVRFSFPSSIWSRLNPIGGFTPDSIAREGVGRSWQDTRLFSSLTVMENVQVASSRPSGEDPFTPVFAHSRIAKQEREQETEAASVLKRFGLEALASRSAMSLSLGDAKRIAIARSICAQARILFLDEPLSGLDGAAAQRTVGELRSMAVEHRMTLVLIEHSFHIPRLLDLVTRVWIIRSGVLLEQSAAEVRNELRAVHHDGVATWTDGLIAKGWSERVEALALGASLTKMTRPAAAETAKVLELRNLTVQRGTHQVIGPQAATHTENGLSFTLRQGEIGILRAPNGWGKTSLAESILGLLPNASGEILHDGVAIQELPSWERAKRGIAFLQARDNVFVSMTPREMMTLRRCGKEFDLTTSLRNRPIEQLSGGERQRVALTTCLSLPSMTLLILDEPFNMVDAAGVARLQEHLEDRPDLAVLILVPGSVQID